LNERSSFQKHKAEAAIIDTNLNVSIVYLVYRVASK